MKVNFNRVGAGAAALLLSAGFLISGGCSSSKVLEQRPYIPAPSGDDVAAVPADQQLAPAPGGEQVKPAVVETAPPAFQPGSTPSQYASPAYHHKSSASSYHGEGQVYTIQKGDSLWKIGHKFGVSTKALAAYNNIPESKMLVVGKTLRIPAGGHKMKSASTSPSTRKKATAATMASSSTKSAEKKSGKPAAKAEKADKGEKSGNGTYVVQKGDSFWKIARKLKVTSADLAAANNKKPTDMLQVGQKLVVPGKGEGKSKATVAKAEKTGKAESGDKKETDDMIKDLDVTASADTAKTGEKAAVKTTGKVEKVGDETAAKAVDAAAPAKAEKATDVTDLESTKSRNVEVTEDTTIEQFSAKNGVKVDEVKKLNPEIGADGKLTKGNIITIPE